MGSALKNHFDYSSYRPITVACNISKILEYVLLPYIIERTAKDTKQFGSQPRIACQHTYKVWASILYDAQSKGYEPHICALGLFKAFDCICHAQVCRSLSEFVVNPSVIHALKFWCINSFLCLKSRTTVIYQLNLDYDRVECYSLIHLIFAFKRCYQESGLRILIVYLMCLILRKRTTW